MASTFRADLEFLAVPALPVSRRFRACMAPLAHCASWFMAHMVVLRGEHGGDVSVHLVKITVHSKTTTTWRDSFIYQIPFCAAWDVFEWIPLMMKRIKLSGALRCRFDTESTWCFEWTRETERPTRFSTTPSNTELDHPRPSQTTIWFPKITSQKSPGASEEYFRHNLDHCRKLHLGWWIPSWIASSWCERCEQRRVFRTAEATNVPWPWCANAALHECCRCVFCMNADRDAWIQKFSTYMWKNDIFISIYISCRNQQFKWLYTNCSTFDLLQASDRVGRFFWINCE